MKPSAAAAAAAGRPAAPQLLTRDVATALPEPEQAAGGHEPLESGAAAATAAAAPPPAGPPRQQQDQSLRLRCELCAAMKRERESAAASASSNKRRKPKEYATVGRLAMHVRAAHEGAHVATALSAEALAQSRPVVVREDGALLVCIKPAGIDTRDFGHVDGMVLLALAEGLTTPQPVHRLDAATSGCLAMGRTKEAVVALNAAFEQRLVKKQYTAIICGELPRELGDSGVIETPLGGKPCVTHFRVVRRDPSLSHGTITTVQLEPYTGRTHQLRRHMEGLGCPIAGDTAYQPWISLKTSGVDSDAVGSAPPLMLWAAKITLPHPERSAAAAAAAAAAPREEEEEEEEEKEGFQMVEADAGPEPPTFEAYRVAERPAG
jgi:23S rRNA-/tRNA-specific pseudouridylate synthase